MTTAALLVDDVVAGEIMASLLSRIGVDTAVLRRPSGNADAAEYIAALGTKFDHLVSIEPALVRGTRPVALRPSLEAWLTRDPRANRLVLGTDHVPDADEASAWLRAREIPSTSRRYAATIDGRALARTLDLSTVAAFSRDFRELISALRPGWVTPGVPRGRGRPPGVAIFRGTGYALCMELLHRGRGASVTPAELAAALGRTRTPVMRLLRECERRGYLRRTSSRGPLVVANVVRLVDDLVSSARADRIKQPPRVLQLSSDRDPRGLPARLARVLGDRGRAMAITGAAAVADLGGDMLVGDVPRAYAAAIDLVAGGRLADAYVDPRAPALVLVEPADEAVLHRMRPGSPPLVSQWQAVIDMLASDSEREREVGMLVRRRLEESP